MWFRLFSKQTNEFILEVLGAGGAVWGMFFAIPNAMIKYFCEEKNCGGYREDIHMFVTIILALLATGNAAYQKYLLGPNQQNDYVRQ